MNMRKMFSQQLKKLEQSHDAQRSRLKSLENELAKSTQEKFDQITERVIKQQNSPIVKQIQQELSPPIENQLVYSQVQLEETKRSLQKDINNQYDEVLGLINSISKVALENEVTQPLSQSQLLYNPQYAPIQILPLTYQPQLVQPLQYSGQPHQDQNIQDPQNTSLTVDDITTQSRIYDQHEQAKNEKLQKIKQMLQQQENIYTSQTQSKGTQQQPAISTNDNLQAQFSNYESALQEKAIKELEHISQRLDQENRDITESEARCKREYEKILQDVSITQNIYEQLDQSANDHFSNSPHSNYQSKGLFHSSIQKSPKQYSSSYHSKYDDLRDEQQIHDEIQQLEREQQLLKQKQEQQQQMERQLRRSQLASQQVSFIPEGFQKMMERKQNLDSGIPNINNDLYQTPYPVQNYPQTDEQKQQQTIQTLEYLTQRINGLSEGLQQHQQEKQNYWEAERNIMQLFTTNTEQSDGFQSRINHLNDRINDMSPRSRQHLVVNQNIKQEVEQSPQTLVIPANLHISKINSQNSMHKSNIINNSDHQTIPSSLKEKQEKYDDYQIASKKLQQLIPGRSREFMYRFYLHLQKLLQKSFSEFLYGVVIANLGQLTDDEKLLKKHQQCGKFQQIIANYFVNKSQIQAAELYVQVVKRLADYYGEEVIIPESLSDAVAAFIEIEGKM